VAGIAFIVTVKTPEIVDTSILRPVRPIA
jgi:hypothetical protein